MDGTVTNAMHMANYPIISATEFEWNNNPELIKELDRLIAKGKKKIVLKVMSDTVEHLVITTYILTKE